MCSGSGLGLYTKPESTSCCQILQLCVLCPLNAIAAANEKHKKIQIAGASVSREPRWRHVPNGVKESHRRNVWARYRGDHTHVTCSIGPRWWTIIKPAIEALWHQCAQPTHPLSKTHSDSFISKLALDSHERLFREGQACLMYGLYKTISSNRRSIAL